MLNMIIRYLSDYSMLENLNVTLDIKKNSQGEIEVNGFNRRTLINNNFFGKS